MRWDWSAQITGYSSFINNGVIINPTSAGSVTASRSGNEVDISILSNAGYTYQLQYSPTLSGGTFTNVGSPQTGTGNTLTFTDTNATGSLGVYRVLATPIPVNVGVNYIEGSTVIRKRK